MDKLQETRRTARPLDLIWRISSQPRRWSRRALAEHYDVSERQITKDLDLLRNGQYGLRFEIHRSPDGYYLDRAPRLPTASFAFEEALAMLLAIQAGRTLAGVDGEALAAAVGRLESLFPRELRPVLRAAEGDSANAPQREQMLAALHRAVGERRQVRIEYAATSHQGRVTERTIDPYAVIPYVKSWHVIGYCHLRQDVRIFKLDRVRRLSLLESRFTAPAAFDLVEFLNRGWGLMRGVAGPVEEVVLRFRPPSAAFVAEEQWHKTQRIEREADGSVIFRVTVIVTPELQRWVFKHGRDVEVLAPAHLREWVVTEARAVAAQGTSQRQAAAD
jgi:predicted DNA-binding transcriptional regulator YafY